MNNVMIDLETLGTAVDSAIVSIGAVCFDPESGALGEKFHRVVDLESNRESGRVIYASSVQWWMQQSDSAREIFTHYTTKHLRALLVELFVWIETNASHDLQVWANGPSFDIAILEHAYESYHLSTPWHFYEARCVRTYRSLPGAQIVPKPKFEGTAHNALDDAINQAEHICAIHQALFGKKVLAGA